MTGVIDLINQRIRNEQIKPLAAREDWPVDATVARYG
jgi:hypothetical protein